MLSLSIIIPTRRFTEALAARIEAHRQLFPSAEIIVAEPTELPIELPPEQLQPEQPPELSIDPPMDLSTELQPNEVRLDPRVSDKSDESARNGAAIGTSASVDDQPVDAGIQRLIAPCGRGTQCNAGAARATGRLLLFLHDDTALPADAPRVVDTAFGDPKTQVACFRIRFDHEHWLLDTYAFFSRFDSSLTSFGDQGILIRRSFFANIGGFHDWPLFEDVDLLSRARRRTRIKKLPAAVTTSAVRFLENGILRQQLLNAELMLRYSFGASPESLRCRYEAGCG